MAAGIAVTIIVTAITIDRAGAVLAQAKAIGGKEEN
jgi:hypothetical protein